MPGPTPTPSEALAHWPAFEVSRPQPVNLAEADAPLFEAERHRSFPAAGVRQAKGVRLHPDGLAFRGLQPVTASFRRPWEAASFGKLSSLRRWLRPSLAAPGQRPVLRIFDQWSGAFFHWMLDALPRLALVQGVLPGQPFTLALPEAWLAPSHFARQTLDQMGIPPEQLLPMPPGRSLHCPTLWLPDMPAETGNYNPELISHVQARLSQLPPAGTQRNQGIYISRAGANRRRIMNEDDLSDVLTGYQIESILAERLQVKDYRKLFSKTNLLVGLHGAGLTNMLFMPPGGTVVELRFRGDATNNAFYALAHACGHHYAYVLVDAAPGQDDLKVQARDAVVQPQALAACLQAIAPLRTLS